MQKPSHILTLSIFSYGIACLFTGFVYDNILYAKKTFKYNLEYE